MSPAEAAYDPCVLVDTTWLSETTTRVPARRITMARTIPLGLHVHHGPVAECSFSRVSVCRIKLECQSRLRRSSSG